MDYVIFLIVLGAGVLLAIMGVLIGAWVMFRGMRAVNPGDPFVVSKDGESVFRLPEPGDADVPDEEKAVLERTTDFLKQMTGGGDA